jgi:hypothetical protein
VSLAFDSHNSSPAINYLTVFSLLKTTAAPSTHCGLIPLSLIGLEKLTLVQLTKNSPTFTEPESSYRVHKKLLLVPTMSHIQLVHTLKPIYLKSLLMLSFHLHLGFPFREKILHAFPIYTTCTIHVYATPILPFLVWSPKKY